MHSIGWGIVRFVFWGSLLLGATASLTGNLDNARDIGGTVGDVGGAGTSGLIVGVKHWGSQVQQGELDTGTANRVPNKR